MQDIVPRKSIRDIDKSAITRGVAPRHVSASQHQKEQKMYPPITASRPISTPPPEYKHGLIPGHKESNFWKYVFVLLVLCVMGTGVYLHSQRTVTVYITPHTASVALSNTQFTISHENTRVIERKKEVEIPIVSSGTKFVEKKAQGTVVLYNKNTQTQVLVVGTRLQANDGKIFTLNTPVTIPAIRNGVPGSVQAVVTAQNSGAEYNITPTDFTIPGLRTSPRFSQVYGRSLQRFQGGSKEEVPVYDEKIVSAAIEKTIRETKNELEDAIKKDITLDERELGVIIWSTTQDVNTSRARVTIEGRQRVVALDSLATQIAKQENIQTLNSGARSDNIQNASISVESSAASSTKILLTGNIKLIASIDDSGLKQVLIGKSFDVFNEIIKPIPGIKSARFSFRPFWIGTFPQENRIVIIKN